MRNALHTLIIVTAALIISAPLQAGTTSSNLDVRSVVPANCRIAISDLAFPAYDPLDQNASRELNGAADVRMICTREARASIVIDTGRNGSGQKRAMSDGDQRVNYQLYRDSNRTQVWGSGASGLQFVSTGYKNPQQFTVYASIPPGQEVASGTYTDVVVATVDF
jgi:spore coat protein U-like protein